ncbi:MAG: sigma-70 family RNA polymerase sigma factor [Methylococcaceae bacterium]|nr:sigma-70 family RNA polymerase sigma factor [Methylococcaceae bacterium]
MTHELSLPEQWLPLYGDILFRYGVSRVRDSDIAEDLVQETLLAALKAKDNYIGQSSEKTWLIGILKHKIIDYFRKTSRENLQELDELSVAAEELGNDSFFNQKGSWLTNLSTWSKPEQSFEQEEFLAILEQCIERLSPHMAQLFILREVEDMSSEEICDVLSISTLNNLWVMLSRIRGQLRLCLDKNWINQ